MMFNSPSVSTKRKERRYSVSPDQISFLKNYLSKNGKVVRHGSEDMSQIVSLYYECDKLKADNNASIRQRTYLSNGLESVFQLPCVVDAKIEVSSNSQIKWRRAFETWQEAQRQLCSSPELRPSDFFPELVSHYGGIGTLSSEYGVKYDRFYFSLPGGGDVTLDTNITVLTIGGSGELTKVSELTEGILELKDLVSASQTPKSELFLEFLETMSLSTSISKRAKARTLIKEFQEASFQAGKKNFE